MCACRRQHQRREERIQAGNLAAGDDGQRTAEVLVQRLKRGDEAWFNHHFVGAWRDIDEGAVEVKKQGGAGGKGW